MWHQSRRTMSGGAQTGSDRQPMFVVWTVTRTDDLVDRYYECTGFAIDVS